MTCRTGGCPGDWGAARMGRNRDANARRIEVKNIIVGCVKA